MELNSLPALDALGPTFAVARRKLSERERTIVRLVALGYGNKDIAGLLSVSVKTVETYKRRSMVKLNLSTRPQLVQYVLRQGWLSLPEASAPTIQ